MDDKNNTLKNSDTIKSTRLQCEEISRYLYWKLLYFNDQLKEDVYCLLLQQYCHDYYEEL